MPAYSCAWCADLEDEEDHAHVLLLASRRRLEPLDPLERGGERALPVGAGEQTAGSRPAIIIISYASFRAKIGKFRI